MNSLPSFSTHPSQYLWAASLILLAELIVFLPDAVMS